MSTLAVVGGWLAAASASASGVSGAIVVAAPATVTRGAAAVNATADVTTTENATFDLDVTASGFTVAFTTPCASQTPSVNLGSCTVDGSGGVTVGQDADGDTAEAVVVRATFTLAVAASTPIISPEGVVGEVHTITVSGTATAPTTGTLTNGEASTTVIPEAGAAVISLATTAPAGTPSVNRGAGSTITYTATFTRSGNLDQVTDMVVELVPDAAQGTAVVAPNPKATITFADDVPDGPETNVRTVSFTVNVPATATPGTAGYHFAASYDPTGTDGTPADMEIGNVTQFTVVAPAATLPGAPTNVSVAPGDGQATVSFSPPESDGGSAITGYTATCGTQSASGPGSPIVVGGLANGVQVTCSVHATNAIGDGPESSPPVPVTPGLPQIVPGAVSVTEGNTGATVAQVPVTLSAPSAQTVTASWKTVNYRATAPEDFVAASGTVSFAPNQTQQTVPITINADLLDEKNETLLVQFSNPQHATIGGFAGLGAVTITDDDPPPQIVPKGASITEGNSGTKVLQVPVTLSAPSGRTVSADWTTLNDQATAPSDYVAASGTVTFKVGQTTKTVAITIKGDTLKEPNERFFVAFSNPTNATIGGIYGLGFAKILNDD